MTTNGYHVTMTGIGIADLKARLSEHLRTVRSGRSLTILDRDTPIARIVPWKQGELLRVRPPRPGAPKLSQLHLPPPLPYHGDIVELLREEREDR
jgi:antitoxin (DNA-binding transcriptional repressor) of toxin-antitoxin stability system